MRVRNSSIVLCRRLQSPWQWTQLRCLKCFFHRNPVSTCLIYSIIRRIIFITRHLCAYLYLNTFPAVKQRLIMRARMRVFVKFHAPKPRAGAACNARAGGGHFCISPTVIRCCCLEWLSCQLSELTELAELSVGFNKFRTENYSSILS